jgi:hypothetical protein
MTLQEQIAEKEQIGMDLLAQDFGLATVTFYIENVDPVEMEDYAKANKIEIDHIGSRLRILCDTKTTHKISVFVFSIPVTVKKTITYAVI